MSTLITNWLDKYEQAILKNDTDTISDLIDDMPPMGYCTSNEGLRYERLNKRLPRTKFEKWIANLDGCRNYSRFEETLLQAYKLADLDNRRKLASVFPEWFVNK